MLIVIKELSYHPYRRAKRYQIQLEFKRNKFNQKGHHESFRFLRKIIKKKITMQEMQYCWHIPTRKKINKRASQMNWLRRISDGKQDAENKMSEISAYGTCRSYPCEKKQKAASLK